MVVGISYGFTYIYYSGKFTFYNIPNEFIEVNVKEIFFTMIILMPLIFNILYALVNELKTKYEDRQKANKFPSYKAIREELNQTEKSLQAIEKEIDDKEVRTIQIKSGAKKISEELESLEKDIKDNSSDKDITEELMERVINVREKMRNSLAVASEIDKNIKEQKEKINIGYHRTNVSKRKLLYGRYINILFYFILTIIILITCFFSYTFRFESLCIFNNRTDRNDTSE